MLFQSYTNYDAASIYVITNICCFVIFGILLYENITGVDRQKINKSFDKVILMHMIYFVIDVIWALMFFNIIKIGGNADKILFGIANLLVYLGASLVSYFWFIYIDLKIGNNRYKINKNKLLLLIPFIFFILLNAILYSCKIGYNVNKNGEIDRVWLYYLFMAIPSAFCVISSIKSIVNAFKKENKIRKKEFLVLSTYPMLIFIFGMVQILVLRLGHELPILCLGTTVPMIYLYIEELDKLISRDSLTGLNNRNELNKYLFNLFKDQLNNETYIMMIDVDYFKQINDKYGHLEGDEALRNISYALKHAIAGLDSFLARYGGDEFIIIGKNNEDLIKERIFSEIANIKNGEYNISLSIGVAHYEENDTALSLMERADMDLYKDKARLKGE